MVDASRLGLIRAGVTACLALVLAPLLLLVGHSAAYASTVVDEPATCTPSPENGCLRVQLPRGVEVAGIQFLVETPSGDTVLQETDEQGFSILEVTEPGEYTVTIDESTLPPGVAILPDAQGNVIVTRTAVLELTEGRQASLRPAALNFSVRAEDYRSVTPLSEQLAQALASGIRLGLLLALASVGLSLIYGTTGLSSFSHAEQVTLGGMTAYVMVQWFGVPFLLAAVLTVIVCGATGYLQDRVIWQPLRHRGVGLIQMMIVTIGLSLALQYTFQVVVGADTVRVLTTQAATVSVGPVTLTTQSLFAMGIAVLVLSVVGFALLRTRLGRATRAVSDNPALAAASGIDVDRVIRMVWILSTALAGLSGVMLALVLNGVKWNSGLQILLLLFAAVTLGGLGTAFGALIGALIIGVMVELTPVLGAPGDLKYATALLVLILLLMVRPQGILGKAQRVG